MRKSTDRDSPSIPNPRQWVEPNSRRFPNDQLQSLWLRFRQPWPLKNRSKYMQVSECSVINCVRHLGFAVLVVISIASAAFSQTQITTGTIQGTVADLNGAVMPGATVEIKNLDTNLSRTMSTDDGGRFVFLALPPGPYSVSVS